VVGAPQALVEDAGGALEQRGLLRATAGEAGPLVERLDQLVPQLLLLVELEERVEQLGRGLAAQGGPVALDRRARGREALALDRRALLEQAGGLVRVLRQVGQRAEDRRQLLPPLAAAADRGQALEHVDAARGGLRRRAQLV